MTVIKTEIEIEQELIQDLMAAQDEITYFGKGGVVRSIFHSIARRLAELWFDYGQKIKALFLSTAIGDDLDIYGESRGITRLEACASRVLMVFIGTNTTVIPEGTEVAGDHGIVFKTLYQITINTDGGYQFGSSGLGASALAESTTKGEITKVGENSINKLVAPIEGVDSVLNPLPAYYGADKEADELYRYRIKYQVSVLNKTTQDFVTEGCKEANEDICRTFVEKAAGENKISVYIIKRSGTFLTTPEKSYINSYLNNRWVIFPQVGVLDFPITQVDISMTLRLVPGYTLAQVFVNCTDGVMNYLDFRTWKIGEDIDSDDILQICLNAEGVDDIDVPNFIPGSNIEVEYNSLPILHNITMINMDNASDTINLNLNPGF